MLLILKNSLIPRKRSFKAMLLTDHFLSCAIILLGKRWLQGRGFSAHKFRGSLSLLLCLPTWVRDLSAWSGLISYLVKLGHFVILKALSVGCCSGAWGLVQQDSISGRICSSGGWLLLLRRSVTCGIRVDVKLCVKSLSAEQCWYIGNDHSNW